MPEPQARGLRPFGNPGPAAGRCGALPGQRDHPRPAAGPETDPPGPTLGGRRKKIAEPKLIDRAAGRWQPTYPSQMKPIVL